MTHHTRSQRLARAAFQCIERRKQTLSQKAFDEYGSFARRFPALVHTCGLAQALAFALAKKETLYADDLADLLRVAGHAEAASALALDEQARGQPLTGYLRISRDALSAAGWLKRYAEALEEKA